MSFPTEVPDAQPGVYRFGLFERRRSRAHYVRGLADGRGGAGSAARGR